MVAKTSTLHVRFDGRSFDISLADLDVGTASTDRQVKEATAQYLDVPANRFRHYVVDRHRGDNMTIRPEAVFG